MNDLRDHNTSGVGSGRDPWGQDMKDVEDRYPTPVYLRSSGLGYRSKSRSGTGETPTGDNLRRKKICVVEDIGGTTKERKTGQVPEGTVKTE